MLYVEVIAFHGILLEFVILVYFIFLKIMFSIMGYYVFCDLCRFQLSVG